MDAANIIMGYKAPQIETPQEQQAKRLTLQNLLQTNQAGQLKLQEAQDARAESDKLKALLTGNPNATSKEIISAGLPTQGMAFGKYEDERTKSASDAVTAKLNQAKTKNSLIGQGMGTLINNPSDENLQSVLSNFVQIGVMSPEEAQAAYAKGPKDPEGIKNLAMQHYQSALDADKQFKTVEEKLGGTNRVSLINQATGQSNIVSDTPITTSADTISNNKRIETEGQLNRDNAVRVANIKEANSGQAKLPVGYRMTPDGNLQAIPGGPADLKLAGVFNQDTAALSGANNSFDRLASAANELLNHPGLKGITGLRGALPNVPGTDAADAQAKLNTLKSQVAFGVLQDMRNNSKTGGALGAVSDKEGQLLQSNLAALENAQSLDQFKSSLKKIIDYTDQAKTRMQSAFNMKHGDSGNQYRPSNPSSAKPATAADYLKSKGL